MLDKISASLLVFARTLVKLVPELQKIGVTVQQLYEALKPVLLQKLQGAGILELQDPSVIHQGGQLIYSVATNPLFWVTLALGTTALAQLGLEHAGYKTAGRLVGVAGTTATGCLVGFLVAPLLAVTAAVAIPVGAVIGALAWTAVDVLKESATTARKLRKSATILRVNVSGTTTADMSASDTTTACTVDVQIISD